MAIIKTISISKEYDELQRQYGLSWTECARVGLSVMLAERGVTDYDNNLNLYRKMLFYRTEMEKLMQNKNIMRIDTYVPPIPKI